MPTPSQCVNCNYQNPTTNVNSGTSASTGKQSGAPKQHYNPGGISGATSTNTDTSKAILNVVNVASQQSGFTSSSVQNSGRSNTSTLDQILNNW